MIKNYILSGTDFSVAGEASSSFKAILKRLGVPAEIVRKVAIAMYEAEINTIIHGGGGECDAEISGKEIKITFRDQGPGIANIDLAMQAGYSTATDQIRELGFGAGMGLPNIKKYTDDMLIDTAPGKGTTLTLIINL
ncbi:MAG: anti-sigma regulatory factor [Clostridia bacterium]|nr:anti-sigma regulatory factor [Clostridia bacterium]